MWNVPSTDFLVFFVGFVPRGTLAALANTIRRILVLTLHLFHVKHS
jgi:DNA-directed RNA polymerase alpha subunit